jgi:hypothetical protein
MGRMEENRTQVGKWLCWTTVVIVVCLVMFAPLYLISSGPAWRLAMNGTLDRTTFNVAY